MVSKKKQENGSLISLNPFLHNFLTMIYCYVDDLIVVSKEGKPGINIAEYLGLAIKMRNKCRECYVEQGFEKITYERKPVDCTQRDDFRDYCTITQILSERVGIELEAEKQVYELCLKNSSKSCKMVQQILEKLVEKEKKINRKLDRLKEPKVKKASNDRPVYEVDYHM